MGSAETKLGDFEAKRIDGSPSSLKVYEGQVVLVVNTASQCGFTPQYHGLERLYQDYKERSFHVLAFPCNQFREQEPGSDDQIAQFCETHFGVSFPVFAKIEVNGKDAHPLYQWLKQQAPGVLGTQAIKWNFTKFLIGRDGCSVQRFAPNVEPDKLRAPIEALL